MLAHRSIAMLRLNFVRSGVAAYSTLSKHGTVFGGEKADDKALHAFRVWHNLIEDDKVGPAKKDSLNSLRSVVADDCVFKPPTYFKPWKGGDETTVILSCAAEVFGSSFKYGRQWLSEDGKEWALEFSATIAETGKTIDGIDLVKLNDDGKMQDFTVLARPPNGVTALKDEMMKRVPQRMAAYKAKKTFSNFTSALGF